MAAKKHTQDFAEGKSRLDQIGQRLGSMLGQSGTQTSETSETSGAAGFLGGLGGLLDQLGRLAQQAEESGGEMSRSGELNMGPNSKMKRVYGFTFKSGLGGDKAVKVEPFGNMRRDEEGGDVVVQEIREPMIDVFDEPDHLLIVAEVPGIVQEDVQLELRDDILILVAEKGEKKYRKEVLLPQSFSPDKWSYSCRNGILEIRLVKNKAGS